MRRWVTAGSAPGPLGVCACPMKPIRPVTSVARKARTAFSVAARVWTFGLEPYLSLEPLTE